MAANGVDLGFGSSADLLDDTSQLYGEDANRLNDNYRNEIRGIDISAANYRADAKAAKHAATGIAISTGFDVAGTILGGVGKSRGIQAARAGGGSNAFSSIRAGAAGYGG